MTIRLAIDIGGTFTDLVLDCHGQRFTAKVLTTPARPVDGLMQGVQIILQQAAIDASAIQLVVHGTTLATNALIERKGAKTALVTTAGHPDTLEMGFENRFDQYDIQADRRTPLVESALRFEVAERVNFRGEVLQPLSDRMRRAIVQRRPIGMESSQLTENRSFMAMSKAVLESPKNLHAGIRFFSENEAAIAGT